MIKNAIVTNATIGFHDGYGSIPVIQIQFDYGGSSQGWASKSLGGEYTHKIIYGLIDLFKVDFFDKIKGQPCRVELTGDNWDATIKAVGSFLEDRWVS